MSLSLPTQRNITLHIVLTYKQKHAFLATFSLTACLNSVALFTTLRFTCSITEPISIPAMAAIELGCTCVTTTPSPCLASNCSASCGVMVWTVRPISSVLCAESCAILLSLGSLLMVTVRSFSFLPAEWLNVPGYRAG